MNAIELCGGALLLACLCVVLRECSFGAYRTVAVVGCVGLLTVAVGRIGGLFEALGSSLGGSTAALCADVLRILGVGYVYGSCAEVCRGVGENGIASAVETVGRVEILWLAVPALREILNMASVLLGSV